MANNSYIAVQLKNGNTVHVSLDHYLTMTDIEWDDLMCSQYGKFREDVFSSSIYNNGDEPSNSYKLKDLDMEDED